jgi:hypothetical protein
MLRTPTFEIFNYHQPYKRILSTNYQNQKSGEKDHEASEVDIPFCGNSLLITKGT